MSNKIKYILIIFLLSSPALAYDDQASAQILISCLKRHQSENNYHVGFQGSSALAQSCQSEAQDFARYNCEARGIDGMACVGAAVNMADIIIKKSEEQ